ncbi:hypothetical protein ACJJTC_013704 [Scirpophaga incertulas]
MAVRVLLLLAVIGYIHCQVLKLSCQQVRQFVDGHNSRREQLLKGTVPGQPAAKTMTYMVSFTWISTLDQNGSPAWFNEYKDYTYGKMKPSDFTGPKDIGHYTQMAWADTTYVGCAISQWSIDGYNKYFVVCNYGPPGNYMDQYPYPSGGPGSSLTCKTGDCSRLYGDNC